MDALTYYSQERLASQYFRWFQRDSKMPLPAIFLIDLVIKLNYIDETKIGIIVDLGCGPGTTILKLNERLTYREIIAIDGSQKMLDYMDEVSLSTVYRIRRMRKYCVNLERDAIPLEKRAAELVTCFSTGFYMKDTGHLFSEASRILAP